MKKVRILDGGPYEVIGDTPLKQEIISETEGGELSAWKEGKTYEVESEYHLCRCGRSENKPFCDGHHKEVHFHGKEVASRAPYDEQATRYTGEEVDLLDNESLCAVARFCDRAGGVWDNAVRSGDEENRKIATYEACTCPSGRLTIVEKDGTKIEPKLEQEISAIQDPEKGVRGPLWVKGGIEIESADGETYEVRNRVTLCRCGESSNMPFCDASHLACAHMRGQDK